MLQISLMILVGVFSASFASAQAMVPAPTNLCGRTNCTPEQTKIWEAFRVAGNVTHGMTEEKVYSGDCYHRTERYNGSHAHHAVAYLDRHEGNIHYTGRFSYFRKENPYKTWTPDDVREQMPPNRYPNSILRIGDNYSWADFHPGEHPIWQYFFRSSGDTLWLIARWDTAHTVFCEMKDNQK